MDLWPFLLVNDDWRMKMFIKAPCQFCDKREVLCRTECEKWKEYTAKKKEEYARKEKELAERNAMFGDIIRVDKMAKRRGGKRIGIK